MLLVAVALAAWAIGRGGLTDAPGGAAPPVPVPLAVTVLATPMPAPATAPIRPEPSAAPTAAAGLSMPARSSAPVADRPPDAASASAASAAPAIAAPARPAASAPVARLAELSEDFRRQLPPLTLGGGMYSEQAANRLAIVNGQPVHEGDLAASELRVVQIRPRAVVFDFRGQRFEMPL
jgi:general secretion pathway protein B